MSSMRKKRKLKQQHARYAVMFRRVVRITADKFIEQFNANIRKAGEAFRQQVSETMEKVKIIMGSPSFQEHIRQHFAGMNHASQLPGTEDADGAVPRGPGDERTS